MLQRKRLPQVSERRRADNHAYLKARQQAFDRDRDRGQCQAAICWPEIECGGVTDPHHIRPVGRHPELRADPDNLVTLCRYHHMACHSWPVTARELGFVR